MNEINNERFFFLDSSKKEVFVQDIPPYKSRPAGLSMILKQLCHLSEGDKCTLVRAIVGNDAFSIAMDNQQYRKSLKQQADFSFYMFFVFLAMLLITSMVLTVLVVTGTIPPSLMSASGMVTSNATCVYCFKLYKDTSSRLERSLRLYPYKSGLPSANDFIPPVIK